MDSMDDSIKQIVEHELHMAKTRILASIKKLKYGNQTSVLKLVFRNRISETILTGSIIEGDANNWIEVALVDESTGQVVDFGPEASARVEILVLNGDFDHLGSDVWTAEEFTGNIVPDVPGKMPFLAGNVLLKLQRGICALENIKFRHHTSKVKPPLFKIGARVVQVSDEVRIKEAKTNSFNVRNFRNKYTEKHEIPDLSDDMWRLSNIGKGGNIEKRLQDNGIYTVEDFLIRLLLDPQGLKNIVNLGMMKWAVTEKHARACPSDKRMYCYFNRHQKTGVVFNIFGQILGLYSDSEYALTNTMLLENQKGDLHGFLASENEPWKNIVAVDNADSIQEHFAHLNSEMISEPSNANPFNIIPSANGALVDDFSFANTEDEDGMYDGDTWQLKPNSPYDLAAFFTGAESFLEDTRAGEEIAAGGDLFVESEVVKTLNRWKILFCVSRWFYVRKMVAIQGNHTSKKRKIV